MRRYALVDGSVLVETGLAVATGFALDENGRFAIDDAPPIEPRTFEHRDTTGTVIATYGQPRTYALDDYFYVLDVHWVADGALVRGTIEIGGARGAHRTRLSGSERVVDVGDELVE
jgi:hypothetical protein